MISLCPTSSPSLLLLLCFLSSAVQLTVPIGGDGQLMSAASPGLWLRTNAVQMTVPIGGDGQLMSAAPPVLSMA